MISWREILFFIVVFLSNVIQCITGFAGTVLAMPFSMMLVGFDTAKPILNVLGIVASIGVVLSNRKGFNKKEFFRIISIMIIGMAGGFVITRVFTINAAVLYKILGVVVILFMLLGCYNTFVKKDNDNKKTSPLIYLVLVAAGLVHGMFVCGGPLLVIYASDKMKDKQEFRVTVSSVWIVLNSIIMFSDIQAGYFNSNLLVLLVISIAILFLSLWVGNMIFNRMNKTVFMVVTYILMAISGASLLFK